MEECCAVCAEPLEWLAYGPCGHCEVCSTCTSRLRFILNDKNCCICKQDCPSVVITKALGDYTNAVGDFSTLPAPANEGKVGNYWFHLDTQAYFDDEQHYKMIKAMCRLSCSVCDNTCWAQEPRKELPKRHREFKHRDQLRKHLFYAHKLSMCTLCLEGRKVFICEQKLYTRSQLDRHLSRGDSEVDGSEIERGGFMGHPICDFCRKRFYGDSELYVHMSRDHYTCDICQRRHPEHSEYYQNYSDLEAHFSKEHFLCENDDCMAKKFVVFASEAELKRHNAIEHAGNMSRSQRNWALQHLNLPYEVETQSDSSLEEQAPRRHHKSGKHVRDEPNTLTELQACPLAMSCFQHLACFEFCQRVANVRVHHELARLFVLHLHGGQSILAGVTFTLTPETISVATGIPNVGEQWHKRQKVDMQHYEPYIKASCLRRLTRVFPFQYLRNEYAPLMRLIMKYFSCKGRFSCLYVYHIRLLMHFTGVRMMNLPFFICREIERMNTFMQHKIPQQQLNSVYHFALIRILVDHQLGLQGIAWEDFISRDFFNTSHVLVEAEHEIGGHSDQYERHETTAMPVSITYQRGSRHLFAAAKRVLSPPGVEGASLPASTTQEHDRGKEPMQDEGPSGEPSGERETEFVLLHDDETDTEPTNAQLKEIIQEQQSEIEALSLDLERAKWNMKYLEQRNKQLEDQQAIMELQNIREHHQAAQRRRVELTSLEQEINEDREANLERVNMHLERLLDKADKDHALLRHMAFHYRARNMSAKARIKSLKAKLSKATKEAKEQDWL